MIDRVNNEELNKHLISQWQNNTFGYVWAPSHVGVYDNEVAQTGMQW